MNRALKFLELMLSTLTKLTIRRKLRGRNVYVVCGLRRSGNHAMIQWLMSSISGETVTYENKGGRINYPSNSTLLFLNNWSGHHNWKRKLSEVLIGPEIRHIIISFEDESPRPIFNFFKSLIDCRAILIRRNRLDLIASRFQTLASRFERGADFGKESSMDCSESFVSMLKEFDSIEVVNDEGIVIFDYDSWISSATWGKKALRSLELKSHSVPQRMTREGGGSSFQNLKNVQDDRLGLLSYPEIFITMLESRFELSKEEQDRIDSVKKMRTA